MSKKTMMLASNDGSMIITCEAKTEFYPKKVWFTIRATTNIVSLCKLIDQHCVNHNSKDKPLWSTEKNTMN